MKSKTTTPVATSIPLGLRRYLYFTAAVTGGCILIVEILGAKMLAPYLGTSHFVWTAQIAVTLVALAAGYYAGGRMVDRSTQLGRLYGSIVASALYLSLTILAVEKVTYWCLRFNLAVGALLASAFLFFVPLALLAMVGPFFIRVITVSVGDVGGNVGRLTALSTLGSFIGTILIGYVLIPFLPNSVTMFLVAAVLVLVAVVYFLVWRRRGQTIVMLAALAVFGAGYAGVRQDQAREYLHVEELAARNSEFGFLQVLQEKQGERRWYLNDYLTQNTYDILAKQSLSMFTYMLHELPKAYMTNITDVLCIGMGVGIVPMEFSREGARVDVVEINPAVVPLAERYFDCEPRRFGLTIGDGRYFVNQTRKRYDVVVLDAFLGDSSPSHLMTTEAFAAMRGILRPAGTLVINCFGDFERDRDFFVSSLDKTLRNVFRSVRIHNDHNGGNVFFVASMQEDLKLRGVPSLETVHPQARTGVKMAFNRILETDPQRGIILRDDYNPVEYYDAANRERVRRNLVMGMKEF